MRSYVEPGRLLRNAASAARVRQSQILMHLRRRAPEAGTGPPFPRFNAIYSASATTGPHATESCRPKTRSTRRRFHLSVVFTAISRCVLCCVSAESSSTIQMTLQLCRHHHQLRLLDFVLQIIALIRRDRHSSVCCVYSVDCAYSVVTVLSLLYSLSLCFVFLCLLVLCVVLFIFCLYVLL